jgi:predicted alpha/beta hydrolase
MSERSTLAVHAHPVRIPADDGYPLHGQFFTCPIPPRAIVIINSATGTPQRYYRRFAEFLASDQFDVITYDYRGIGQSAPTRLRGFPAQMRDWGQLDFPGIIRWCQAERPGLPILAVGHSVGGQILGLAPNRDQVQAMIFVCSQHTYWRHWPKAQWPKLWMLWHVLLPGLSHTIGYFPSPWLGMGEILPKGVAIEWAQWARASGYVGQVIGPSAMQGFASYAGRILSLSFEDDHFAPERAAAELLKLFPSAHCEHRHVNPRDQGYSVGHFGYFRSNFRDTLWPTAKYWLTEKWSGHP